MTLRHISLRHISFIALAAAVAGAAYFAFFEAPRAPEVNFKTLAGENIATSDLRGKVVLNSDFEEQRITLAFRPRDGRVAMQGIAA